MFTWFNNWFYNKCRDAWDHGTGRPIEASDSHYNSIKGVIGKGMAYSSTPSPNVQSINFQIYPATGGHVVEIHFSDNNSMHVTNIVDRSLHIIPSSDDLGPAISKIITYEMLKR